jgi:Mg2+/Co2+ transporter CorB
MGLLTLEDIVEELIGEVRHALAAAAGTLPSPAGDGDYLVEGASPLRELNSQAGVSLPAGRAARRLMRLILEHLQDIPEPV